MKIIQKIKEVHYLFKIDNVLAIQRAGGISLFDDTKLISVDESNGFYRRNHYYRIIDNTRVEIYNQKLDLVNSVEQNGVGAVLDIFDGKSLIMNAEEQDKDDDFFYINNNLVEVQSRVWGVFLNKDYRLNYTDNVINNPTFFRCSDLLDKQTYFEYQCEEGFEIVNKFHVWKGQLLFMVYKDLELYLISKEIKTGKTSWKTRIEDSGFVFDEERGIMVSIRGSNAESPEKQNKYQIIDLTKQQVTIEIPDSDYDFFHVESNPGMQYLEGSKLYFADNRTSFTSQTNPVYIGCFDIITKQVDFMQPVPEMSGTMIAQIICNEGKLYARGSNTDLLIFEL